MAFNTGRILANVDLPSSSILGTGRGRGFGDWISSRTTGYVKDDMISQPAYIIESLIRDEIMVERDLKKSANSFTLNYIAFNGSTGALLSSVDDYYNGAYLHSVDGDWVKLITDYDGANKRVYVSSLTIAEVSSTNDDFFITNINVNIKTSTFDTIGNTTNGTRGDWEFGRSIASSEPSQSLLQNLCFESHTILLKTFSEWKLIALDTGTSVGTLSQPLYQDGRPLMAVSLTSLDNVYSEFQLKYNYDYGKNDYIKKAYVNKDTSSNVTYLGTTQIAACRNAEKNYKMRKVLEWSSNWIYDDTTAYKLLQKWVGYFTKQKLNVSYFGDVANHIKYEVGDLVKINYSDMMPTANNNSTIFMIYSKEIKPIRGMPQVGLKLMEMV